MGCALWGTFQGAIVGETLDKKNINLFGGCGALALDQGLQGGLRTSGCQGSLDNQVGETNTVRFSLRTRPVLASGFCGCVLGRLEGGPIMRVHLVVGTLVERFLEGGGGPGTCASGTNRLWVGLGSFVDI